MASAPFPKGPNVDGSRGFSSKRSVKGKIHEVSTSIGSGPSSSSSSSGFSRGVGDVKSSGYGETTSIFSVDAVDDDDVVSSFASATLSGDGFGDVFGVADEFIPCACGNVLCVEDGVCKDCKAKKPKVRVHASKVSAANNTLLSGELVANVMSMTVGDVPEIKFEHTDMERFKLLSVDRGASYNCLQFDISGVFVKSAEAKPVVDDSKDRVTVVPGTEMNYTDVVKAGGVTTGIRRSVWTTTVVEPVVAKTDTYNGFKLDDFV